MAILDGIQTWYQDCPNLQSIFYQFLKVLEAKVGSKQFLFDENIGIVRYVYRKNDVPDFLLKTLKGIMSFHDFLSKSLSKLDFRTQFWKILKERNETWLAFGLLQKSRFFSAWKLKKAKFQNDIYPPRTNRTEMLGTDPGSKFQGASFLFQQCLGPRI